MVPTSCLNKQNVIEDVLKILSSSYREASGLSMIGQCSKLPVQRVQDVMGDSSVRGHWCPHG